MSNLSEEEYKYCCNLLINNNTNLNQQYLQALKNKYEEDINSKRRLECITNISEVLQLLEKRGCLSKNNINILYEIAQLLNQQNLTSQFRCTANRVNPSNEINSSHSEPAAVRERVYVVICGKLGKSWLEFARALDIQECKIDELKIKYSDHKWSCIKEILEIYNNECPRHLWNINLLNALTKARRNDLRKLVEDILNFPELQ